MSNPDPSGSDSVDLGPVDQFVENESLARFDISPPVELLDWELLQHVPGGGSHAFDVENFIREQEINGEEDEEEREERGRRQKEREEKMTQRMWERLNARLEQDGYQALRDIESRLETYKAEEDLRRHRLGTKHHAVKEYRTLLGRLADEFRLGARLAESLQRKSLQRKFDLSWEACATGSSRKVSPSTMSAQAGKSDRVGEHTKFEWQVTLELTEGHLREFGFSEETSTAVHLEGGETLGHARDRLERLEGKLEKKQGATRSLQALIGFRLELIRRFLWTLEIAGETVRDPTTDKIPDKVKGHPAPVKQACCVLQLKPLLSDEEGNLMTHPPTQKNLIEHAKEAYDEADIPSSHDALVKGATKLIRDHLFEDEYESFRESFYHLLFAHEEQIFEVADRMGIDLPSPTLDIEE